MAAHTFKIEKFNGKDSFSLWRIKIRALLKQQGIWTPVTGTRPDSMKESDYALQDEKAHSTILLCLGDEVIYEVAEEESAAGLWSKLESLYMTKSLTSKLLLKQRLFALRMNEGMLLNEHLDKLNRTLMDLKNLDVMVEDEDAALILLVSLPPSYENFVNSIIVGKDSISLEEVRSALHSRELRHKASGANEETQTASLLSTNFGNGNGKGRHKGRNANVNPRDICNYCKEPGHWKKDCPKIKDKAPALAVAKEDTLFETEEDSVLSAVDYVKPSDQWMLDTGCSHHMCPNREWFSTYEKLNGGSVVMGNGAPCKVIGIGTVKIRMHDGKVRILTGVRHVPDLKKNLISLGTMDSKGYKYHCESGALKITKGKTVVMKGLKRKTLYMLQGTTIVGSAAAASYEETDHGTARFWQPRFVQKVVRKFVRNLL